MHIHFLFCITFVLRPDLIDLGSIVETAILQLISLMSLLIFYLTILDETMSK
jgi:hypothetical protein